MKASVMIPPPLDDCSMSNLTCASNEASNISSSSNRNHEVGLTYHHPSQSQPPPSKKRRNLPGNPDPDAEVVALSPTTLMSTGRFICEICNKGFQRDQNLQLHRRGHNLPWKLKQRTNKELPIKKKVYVCPEVTCVHHDPSRALGDLTGIKKHFFRKHGEKKWKCEKCSKRYAVQSDWKAHSKICGTKEYRCDCGTLFSRRDSFITHRAFCDALAEESHRVINAGGNTTALRRFDVPTASTVTLTQPPFVHLKREQQQQHQADLIPPNWLSDPQPLPLPLPLLENDQDQGRGPGPPSILDLSSSTQLFPLTRLDHHNQNTFHHHYNQNPAVSLLPPIYEPCPSPHMSATALLQKAAQMGANHSLPEQSIDMGISTNTWSAGLTSTRLQESLLRDGLISNTILNITKLESNIQEPPIGGRGINGNEELTRDFLGLRSAIGAGADRGGIGRGFTNMRGMNGIQSSSSTLYNNNSQQTQNHHHHQTPNWKG